MSQQVKFIIIAQFAFILLTSAASTTSDSVSNAFAALDSSAYKIVSDEDSQTMQLIKNQMNNDYQFKSIDEVISFLEKVRILVQKHPKNIAFAQGDLKDLYKFLSQEIVTKLIRVDTDPFYPIPDGEDKMALANRALEEDDLVRKLFGVPFRSLVEARRRNSARADNGDHKDGNFFTNFWCKISGCNQ